MKSNINLKISNSVYIRALLTTDVSENYVNWLNTPEIVKFTEQKEIVHSYKSTLAFVEKKILSNNEYLFGIFENNTHIGNIKLGPIDLKSKTASVGYIIGNKKYWGKGLATKAIKYITEYALSTLKLKKITAGTHIKNKGSIKALERNGFIVDKGKTIKLRALNKNNENIYYFFEAQVNH